MKSITVKAHAKVNLFLKVLSRRKDAYHNIHTIFERISLADTIKITRIPKGIIVRSDRPVTRRAKDNLVYKAAEAILRRGKVKGGVRIRISKRIPIAAGLGGGSSDAAATLIGINKLFGLRLGNDQLMRLGRRLGADVPFFLLDTPFAAGRGIGDDLTIMDPTVKLWHLLIYPGFKVSTKDIYAEFDRIPKRLTPRQRDVRMVFPFRGYEDAIDILYNDLEQATVLKKGVLGGILESLAQLLGKRPIVSGSGPSLFCLYGTGKEAFAARRKVLRSMPANGRRPWQVFVVQTS